MSKISSDNLKGNYLKAYKALEKIGAPVFVRSDRPDGFMISAETGGSGPNGLPWADYYDNCSQPFGVNPAIESILSANKLFSEWENPGALGVYDI
jgi:hypothetical protein